MKFASKFDCIFTEYSALLEDGFASNVGHLAFKTTDRAQKRETRKDEWRQKKTRKKGKLDVFNCAIVFPSD